MALVPRTIPMIDDPQVAIALATRWHRARILVLISMVALPAFLVLVSLGFVVFAEVAATEWWSAIPVLAAGMCAAALVAWLRRNGLTDPASWFPATVLMTGCQLVLGVVPGFGIAVRSATGTTVVVKALLAIGVLSAGSAWSLSRRACRSLVTSPVAELGATPLLLMFRSCRSRIVIGTDRVDWTLRGADGGRFDTGVSFRHLHGVTVEPRGLALHTSSGRWTVPAREAAAVCELLRLRKAWWEQRLEAVIEQERERYQELVHLLSATRATVSTADESVSVTVNADGITTHIELSDGIRHKSPGLISADLMACIERARGVVREHVQDLVLERYVDSRGERELADLAWSASEKLAA